jgi:predicted HicB family RNase H-like nuclease
MKRIIDGVAYNTETSTEIAKYEYQNTGTGEGGFEILFQTRGGAFFTHGYQRTAVPDEAGPNGSRLTEINTFHPLTRDEAQDWIMTGNVEVFSDIFGELPEAADELHTESTIYVRVPTSLKDRIDAAAKAAGQSVNAWALRCLENGASSNG